MSRRPKNNHYHYAEKFTDRAYLARRDRRVLALPRRFMLLAAVAGACIAASHTYARALPPPLPDEP